MFVLEILYSSNDIIPVYTNLNCLCKTDCNALIGVGLERNKMLISRFQNL